MLNNFLYILYKPKPYYVLKFRKIEYLLVTEIDRIHRYKIKIKLNL